MKFLVTGGTGFIGASVVDNLLARGIPVVIGEVDADMGVASRLQGTAVEAMDVADAGAVEAVFDKHPDITHCVHLAYLMSAEVEADPPLGVRVNVLGMTHMFEAAVRHKLKRLVFTSSETVYGRSQKPYGNRPVTEDDFCAPSDLHFTYGAMKILNEFMADKYAQKHGVSFACVRPAIVFGHGRKRGSLLWAEAFASNPAVGRPAELPFPADTRDTWIYKDDCAEQIIRLSLKPELAHFAYNNGGTCASAHELVAAVRQWIPDADIAFDESRPTTPLIDWQHGQRLIDEVDFTPRSLADGVRAHINQARAEAGLNPV
ncbi:MAG: NAD(P)-dependent oxidoreductase [Hyphomicrobiales bacterium]|nr:NAD(P)-dependent oxidoreductase [Hyphomicrobiales bacterium]